MRTEGDRGSRSPASYAFSSASRTFLWNVSWLPPFFLLTWLYLPVQFSFANVSNRSVTCVSWFGRAGCRFVFQTQGCGQVRQRFKLTISHIYLFIVYLFLAWMLHGHVFRGISLLYLIDMVRKWLILFSPYTNPHNIARISSQSLLNFSDQYIYHVQWVKLCYICI